MGLAPKQLAHYWREVHGALSPDEAFALQHDDGIAALERANPFLVRRAVRMAKSWQELPALLAGLATDPEPPSSRKRRLPPEPLRTCRSCRQQLPVDRFDTRRSQVCSRCRQASRGRSSTRNQTRVVSGGLPSLGKRHQ
jgi:hypothetical protein